MGTDEPVGTGTTLQAGAVPDRRADGGPAARGDRRVTCGREVDGLRPLEPEDLAATPGRPFRLRLHVSTGLRNPNGMPLTDPRCCIGASVTPDGRAALHAHVDVMAHDGSVIGVMSIPYGAGAGVRRFFGELLALPDGVLAETPIDFGDGWEGTVARYARRTGHVGLGTMIGADGAFDSASIESVLTTYLSAFPGTDPDTAAQVMAIVMRGRWFDDSMTWVMPARGRSQRARTTRTRALLPDWYWFAAAVTRGLLIEAGTGADLHVVLDAFRGVDRDGGMPPTGSLELPPYMRPALIAAVTGDGGVGHGYAVRAMDSLGATLAGMAGAASADDRVLDALAALVRAVRDSGRIDRTTDTEIADDYLMQAVVEAWARSVKAGDPDMPAEMLIEDCIDDAPARVAEVLGSPSMLEQAGSGDHAGMLDRAMLAGLRVILRPSASPATKPTNADAINAIRALRAEPSASGRRRRRHIIRDKWRASTARGVLLLILAAIRGHA